MIKYILQRRKKKFQFLFLSRLEKGKGHNFTLNSFKKLNKKKCKIDDCRKRTRIQEY